MKNLLEGYLRIKSREEDTGDVSAAEIAVMCPAFEEGEEVIVNTICKNCQSSGTEPIVKGRYVECWYPDLHPRNAENETLRVDSVKHPVEEAIKEFILGKSAVVNDKLNKE